MPGVVVHKLVQGPVALRARMGWNGPLQPVFL